MDFMELCEEFLLDCESRRLREGTIKHYKDSIKQLYKYIDPATEISKLDFKEFLSMLDENKQLNTQSVFSYARDLKTILRYAMKQEYVRYSNITLPKVDKKSIETYSDEELRKLLKKPKSDVAFTEYRSYVIVNLLLCTGIRERSILNLKNKDVDLENEVLHVNVTKNHKPLILPLNREMVLLFKKYLRRRGGGAEDYLFPNCFGEQLSKSSIIHSLYEYHKKCGVTTTGIHRYRHSFAKKWITSGGNVVTLKKILGHSSLEITQNYINLLVSDLKEEVERVNILRELGSKTKIF